jgi:DNA repair protein RecN (Recombination protein N)
LIENDQNGISSLLEQLFSSLKELNKIDPSTSSLSQTLENVQENIASIQNEISGYMDSLSFEPGQADQLNQKYDAYYDILKKYGPNISDAKVFHEKAKEKYETIIDLEHSDKDIRAKIALSRKTAEKTALKLSEKRKQTAKELAKTIETELKQLGIENVIFECKISPIDLDTNGKDSVSFYISPNKGEELKPLAKIVSSGEAARVMLALKKALTNADPIPCLIFDEIDAQIGGRLGAITGKKLKELSKDRQVILITHLPQIASFANAHFKVLKIVRDNRTYTTVESLNKEAIIQELAHMMSGQVDSAIAIKHAKDMLASAARSV